VPVVFEGEPSDTALARGLSETAPRVVVATDREAARQLMRLRTSGIPLVVPDGTEPVDPAALTLGTLLDLAAALDTAERAGWFRQRSRSVDPDSEACWHVSRDGAIARLAHRDVMGLVATRLASAPLLPGDVVYLESPRIALAARIALYSLVGDGRAVTTLGRDGQLDGDLAAVRPHGLLATSLSLARLWQEVRAGQEGEGGRLGRLLPAAWPRRPMRGLRKALRAKLGDRLRLVEAVGPVAADIAAWLGRSGITLTSTGDSKEVNA
jgi:hypothetical protein